MEKDERLVFLHIPKCGGTSLSEVLKTNFPDKEICPHISDALARRSHQELAKWRYFSGHYSKLSVDTVPGPKWVVTLLREPKARVLSLYYFWRAHKDDYIEKHNLGGPRLARQMDLLSFLKSEDLAITRSIRNTMMRTLLTSLQVTNAAGYVGRDPAFSLETALANLARFNYVAFTETMNEDVAMLTRLLGLTPADAAPRTNTFESFSERDAMEPVERETVTPQIEQALNRATRLDRELYERAFRLRHTLRCPYPN
ncbi:MAG: hypothetical protein AcusKO_15450 [Acuticoccus sp.]